MELVLESDTAMTKGERGSPFWRSPAGWLTEKKLSRDFWVVFAAAFFFDFGFSIFAFMFNLYLLDLHFSDRAIGLIGGASKLGSVVGTLPAGLLSRRFGLRPMLIVCFVAAPLLGALRALAIGEHSLIGLGFVDGLAMCMWGVCFLPAVARTTTAENRASGFSLIFSTAIGTAILGSVLCGFLPQWLTGMGFAMPPVEAKRLILLLSCGIAAIGLVPTLRMRLPLPLPTTSLGNASSLGNACGDRKWRQLLKIDPFLLRFLPVMALWTIVLTSFTPFANVYLSRNLRLPLSRLGLIFSAAQVIQFCVTMLTPKLFRAVGLINGIVATQLVTAVALACLAATRNVQLAVPLYLGFFAMLWMSSPGLYNLMMSKVPDEQHSAAASMALFSNALVGAGSTAGAGILFARFGYPPVLLGIAGMALIAALLFKSLGMPGGRKSVAD